MKRLRWCGFVVVALSSACTRESPSGHALASADGGTSGAGGEGGRGEVASVPRLLGASPPDGATDVYPSPLPSGVIIALRFSEEMSKEQSEVTLEADDVEERGVPLEWSDDGMRASVTLAPDPLTGAAPLRDLTSYALELGGLQSALGAPLDPRTHLSDGALRFTTGTLDPLLNHACGHLLLGPFGEASAAPAPGPLAVPTDTGHVNYSIVLPESERGYEGFTRVMLVRGRTYHFLLDRDAPLGLWSDGDERPLPVEPAAGACAGISHRAALTPTQEGESFLRLGPISTPSLGLIVEIVSAGG